MNSKFWTVNAKGNVHEFSPDRGVKLVLVLSNAGLHVAAHFRESVTHREVYHDVKVAREVILDDALQLVERWREQLKEAIAEIEQTTTHNAG